MMIRLIPPHVQFQLSQNISSSIIEGIEVANIDIGFCSPLETNEHLHYLPVLTEELFLLVPPSHRLAGKEEINLKEVADDPFILFNPRTALHDLIERLCHKAGFEPKKVFEGFEERTVVNLVGANMGVAIIPYLPNLDPEKISILKVQSPRCFREIHMVWKKDGYLSPATQNFINFVKKKVEVASYHEKTRNGK